MYLEILDNFIPKSKDHTEIDNSLNKNVSDFQIVYQTFRKYLLDVE